MPGWISRCINPISGGLPATSRGKDRRRCAGHSSKQRSPPPDPAAREYVAQAADRLGANRACLSVARKLLKRSYHVLRELGEEALAPA